MSAVSTAPFEENAIVRMKDGARTAEDSMTRLRSGQTFTVDFYVPAEESDDGRAYYEGSTEGGSGNVIAYAEDVELHMSADAAQNRQPPTPHEIIRGLDLLVSGDRFDTDEADWSAKNGTAEVYGTTADGLRFGFTITVSDVQRTDF